jgi:hypothetical protein
MSWTRTHEWWQTLRAIEAELDGDGHIPWRPEYADLFGDPNGLLRALHYRWTLLVQAQTDPCYPAGRSGTAFEELVDAHPGLLAALGRHLLAEAAPERIAEPLGEPIAEPLGEAVAGGAR